MSDIIDKIYYVDPERSCLIKIGSRNPSNFEMGSGFIIYRDQSHIYFVTCYHIIKNIGGTERMSVSFNIPDLILDDDLTVLAENELADLVIIKAKISSQSNQVRTYILPIAADFGVDLEDSYHRSIRTSSLYMLGWYQLHDSDSYHNSELSGDLSPTNYFFQIGMENSSVSSKCTIKENNKLTNYDAFISYRHQEPDQSFAYTVLERLESYGYKVAIDGRDFNASGHFLEEMERCVRESRFTLLVVSPRYFESGNTQEEAIICKVLDMEEKEHRLIPLMIEQVNHRPAWLYGIVGIDFTNKKPLMDPFERLKEALCSSAGKINSLNKSGELSNKENTNIIENYNCDQKYRFKTGILEGMAIERERIKGNFLPNRSQINQDGFWVLDFNIIGEKLLKPGFSGGPILDTRRRVVVGFITHLKMQGKAGQATSIWAIRKIWDNFPPNIWREKTYDLENIYNRLKLIFDHRNDFESFCLENFPNLFSPDNFLSDDPFDDDSNLNILFWYVILQCHRSNYVAELVRSVKVKLDFLGEKTFQESSHKIGHSKLFKILYSFFRYRNKTINNDLVYRRYFGQEDRLTEAQITVKSRSMGVEKIDAIKHALASETGYPISKFDISELRRGSIIIRLSLPFISLDRILEIYEDYEKNRKRLGLVEIIEIIDNDFRWDNIYKVLSDGLDYSAIEKVYKGIYKDLSVGISLDNKRKKEIIAEIVLQFYRDKNRIPDLLKLVKNIDSKAYTKFSPYHFVPKRPFCNMKWDIREKSRFFDEIIRVLFSGTVVAIIGGVGLYLGYVLLNYWTGSENFSSLVWLFLGWLGKSVGKTVTHVAKGKRNKKLGILSTSGFVIGYNFGAILGFCIYLWLSGALISGDALAELAAHISNFLTEIVNLVNLLSNPAGSLSTIGLAYGGYNAYRTASA